MLLTVYRYGDLEEFGVYGKFKFMKLNWYSFGFVFYFDD